MKKCPNCGRILHDDSIFCFGCMSEINKRQEIVLATHKKVFLKAKITTPIIAVALVSATVFGVYTYNNNSDKTTAVKKSTPRSTATVTTNTPVTTTLPPVTTVMTTTTKKREPDKSALVVTLVLFEPCNDLLYLVIRIPVVTALYGPAHKSRSSTLFISFDRCRVHIYYRMLKVANNHRCIVCVNNALKKVILHFRSPL